MSWALKTSIRRSYSRLLASSDFSLKRQEPKAPDGVERSRAIAAARLLAGVDQVFGQRADDAVAPGVDLADLVLVGARGFDHAAGRCVDDGGDTARLCVEGVLRGHVREPPCQFAQRAGHDLAHVVAQIRLGGHAGDGFAGGAAQRLDQLLPAVQRPRQPRGHLRVDRVELDHALAPVHVARRVRPVEGARVGAAVAEDHAAGAIRVADVEVADASSAA